MLKVVQEFISAEQAQSLLAVSLPSGHRQRPIAQPALACLARDMAESRWDCDNTAPIVLGPGGCVLDGQHRLTALVKSGLPGMLFYVVRNSPISVMRVLDTGRSRSIANIYTMQYGGSGRPNARIAVLTLLLNMAGVRTKKRTFTELEPALVECSDVLDWCLRYPDRIEPRPTPSGGAGVRTGFLIAHLARYPEHELDAFMAKLVSGQCPANSPAAALRSAIVRQGPAATIQERVTLASQTVLCIMSHLSGVNRALVRDTAEVPREVWTRYNAYAPDTLPKCPVGTALKAGLALPA